MTPFAIPLKKNKIPRKKFNQGDERPVHWKLMTLMEEIEEETKIEKLCAHRLEEWILLKYPFYPIYKYNTIFIKMSMVHFTELEQIIIIFLWNHRKPWIVKMFLIKNKIGCIISPGFKVHYKATVMKNSVALAQKWQFNETQWGAQK